jgi:hypothetical protein
MSSIFNVRSLFCLGIVLVLHIVIIFALPFRTYFPKATRPVASYLQYVSIVQPMRLPTDSSITKTINAKNDLPANSATGLPPTLSAPSEPARGSTSSRTGDNPKLDWETLRANAVRHELNRERSPIELQNEGKRSNRSLEARLEKGANEATRTDCRTAYAQTGLFAPLFIAANLLSDKGCKF